MSHYQDLTQSSVLKLLAGVFFAAFILTACGSSSGDSAAPAAAVTEADCYPEQDFVSNMCTYETAEYLKAGRFATINLAGAYTNIQTRIDADTTNTVKQGGEGQIIAIVSDAFATTHKEFYDSATKKTKFTGIFDIKQKFGKKYGIGYTETGNTESFIKAGTTVEETIFDAGGGNCVYDSSILNINARKFCSKDGIGTTLAGIIAGNKDDSGIHGVAYNAQLKGIKLNRYDGDADFSDYNIKEQIEVIKAGSGADIAVMHNSWGGYTDYACFNQGGTAYLYNRQLGADVTTIGYIQNIDGKVTGFTCNETKARNSPTIDAALVTAWKAAVDSGTIAVFGNGDDGSNSETGIFEASSDPDYFNGVAGATMLSQTSDVNIPSFLGAYPAYDTSDDLEAGRWLTVAAVDANNVISSTSNGCGIAQEFCLVAPGEGVYSSSYIDSDDKSNYATAETDDNNNRTDFAAAHVSGALAVLKGAFPSATPEQLVKLVLYTADYIPLDNKNPDGSDNLTEESDNRTLVTTLGGTDIYTNPVYGFGMLNLAVATTPNIEIATLSVGNNESIGILWKDSSLTLPNHFGGGLENVTLGITDIFGRHFTTKAQQTSYAPVIVGLDDYMAGFFGEHVQSNKLGAQAKANYSNSTSQSWMDFEYKAGKATTKIAFQENYKTNPLTDMGATSILRANNIRPASNNIGMMDVDYQLDYGAGNNVSLSSYAARGEYDTGYRFDELGTDIDLRHKKSTLNIGIGHLREHEQFLGTNTSGAYELSTPSVSQFTDVTYGHDVGKKFNIYANYINYKTDVDMGYQDFADIEGLQADQYQVGFKGKNILTENDGLDVALITKLGVTDGTLNQNTVLGYTDTGEFNNVTQSYDLSVQERHQQLEITYQGKLYQHADKVSALKDNRFFTTLRVEQNLNHVQGASQTEIMSGIRARF